MRASTLSAAAIGFLVLAVAAPLAAQGGGKKHHKGDTTQTPAAAQHLDFTVVNNPALSVSSDLTYTGPVEIKTSRTVSSVETGAKEVFGPVKFGAFAGNPVGFKWTLKDNQGWVAVVLSGDGTVGLTGQYTDKTGSSRPFEVVFAIKDGNGRVSMVHGVLVEEVKRARWTTEMKTYDLPFGEIRKGGEIRGAYRLPTMTEAKTAASAPIEQHPCKTEATVAGGWAPIWTWAAHPMQCLEYQPNAYSWEAY